jgi:superfamily II DNA or RNA helicase
MFRDTKEWFIIDKGNKPVVVRCIDLIKKEVPSAVSVDISVFPRLLASMQYSIKWELLDERIKYQKEIVSKWVEKGYGQIVAPPRSGKTVISALLSSRSNTRVVIIVHQKELIDQFYNTFMEFTDIQDKGRIMGRSLIKINPLPSEVGMLSVCLYTWQQFLSKNGSKRLLQVRDKFGLQIIDEVHKSSADRYSEIVSRFKSKYRCGFTATPERRDQLDFRQDNIIGPPTVIGGREQLQCEYTVVNTQWLVPEYQRWSNQKWNFFWNRISKDEERNNLIIDYAVKDVAEGHKIIIPVKRVAHAQVLADAIGKRIEGNTVAFVSSVKKRAQVSEGIRAGEYDVVTATKNMISLGFDAPPMSCLYVVVPVFDKNVFYQEYSRIRTVFQGKKKPLIRLFVDEGGMVESFIKMAFTEFKKRKFTEVTEEETEDFNGYDASF